ncbi:MAG: HIT domain-containing protein [Candidatus Omnitrophica bacterium]|nr:HIT domain-containing protein [Candidatus Omnitrophota bacterium]
MDKLWAPWRMKYLRQGGNKRKCIFCGAAGTRSDKKHFVVLRSRNSLALLNIFPYNNGHLMVVPRRHVAELSGLSKEEIADLIGLLNRSKLLLDKVLKPQGYNVGMNLGKVSGAGFPGHLHIHIVPRWAEDTNFMPVIAGTKVISQSLEELYNILRHAEKQLHRRV